MSAGLKTMIGTLLLVALVVTVSQILMKLAASKWSASGTFFNAGVISMFTIAMAVGLAGQLLWFYVLKSTELSMAYIFLALVFVFVPVAAYTYFGEKMTTPHVIGAALVVLGAAITGFGAR